MRVGRFLKLFLAAVICPSSAAADGNKTTGYIELTKDGYRITRQITFDQGINIEGDVIITGNWQSKNYTEESRSMTKGDSYDDKCSPERRGSIRCICPALLALLASLHSLSASLSLSRSLAHSSLSLLLLFLSLSLSFFVHSYISVQFLLSVKVQEPDCESLSCSLAHLPLSRSSFFLSCLCFYLLFSLFVLISFT